MKKRCTKILTERIAKKVRLGASIKRAAPACGVPWNTVKEWNRKGREAAVDDNGRAVDPAEQCYVDWWSTIERAKAQFAERTERKLARAIDDPNLNYKPAAYILERRYGKEYRLAPLPRELSAPPGSVGDEVPSRDDDDSPARTILVYPVPVPIGTDPRTLRLPVGHVLDTQAEEE